MKAQGKTPLVGAGRSSVRHKLLNFILRPHIPWFVRMRFPRLARLLKFGRFNPNTQAWWDRKWREGTYAERPYEQLRQAILQAVPLGSTVLDAGCGSGTLMEMLRDERCCKCVGVDISAQSVAITHAKGFPCYRTELSALPAIVKQMTFDVCTITETLEHLSSPRDTVMSLRDVLRPDGLIVATTPDMSEPDEWGDEWTHINPFTPESLTALFEPLFCVETCRLVDRWLLLVARRADTVLGPSGGKARTERARYCKEQALHVRPARLLRSVPMNAQGRMPLVSAIIPTYNRAEFLAEAIESALAQTYQNIEVVVVDDGSTENTREIVHKFGTRVRYIYQDNAGVSAARNTGFRASTGQFIAPLDSDDVWLPEKTAKQVEVFSAAPQVDVVFGVLQKMDARGHVLDIAPVRPEGWDLSRLPLRFPAYVCKGDILTHIIERNVIPHISILIRREALRRVGGYDVRLAQSVDFDLWLRLAFEKCQFAFLDELVCKYRLHGSQLTFNQMRQKECNIRALMRVIDRERCPTVARQAARRRIGDYFKVGGDYALAAGDSKKARWCYAQAMRYRPRPAQLLSCAFTFLGSMGLRGARLLNPGSEIFAHRHAAAHSGKQALGKR